MQYVPGTGYVRKASDRLGRMKLQEMRQLVANMPRSEFTGLLMRFENSISEQPLVKIDGPTSRFAARIHRLDNLLYFEENEQLRQLYQQTRDILEECGKHAEPPLEDDGVIPDKKFRPSSSSNS